MTPEEFVIGCCLLNEDVVPFAVKHIEPGDFTSVANETLFHAIVTLRKAAEPVEPFTVHARAVSAGMRGVELPDLYTWIEHVGSATSVEHYAQEVREQANRRRLASAANAFRQEVADPGVPAADAVSKMMDRLTEIRERSTGSDISAMSLGQILDMEVAEADWVIPNLFERGDRMIVTGWEGLGKTTWLRQMGICAAAGINPITLDHLARPVRSLFVDVENSREQWNRETKGIAHVAGIHGIDSPRENMHVHCSRRMDLRRDKDLGLVHRLVDEHEPEILFIGPIYRLTPNGIKNDEEAAPLIAALDTLRDRGLVLVMEAHAPKGSDGDRNLAPRGSAALMGWPEFGFGLAPNEDGAEVTRWRGDRDRNRDWPKKLWKGGPFPWTSDTVTNYTRQKFYTAD